MKHIDFTYFLIILLSLMSSPTILAQSNGRLKVSNNNPQIGTGWKDGKSNDDSNEKSGKFRMGVGRKSLVKLEKSTGLNSWKEEIQYFEDVRLDSLWYVGVGNPIPYRIASKMRKVYRLSMKLSNGKFIHVECLDRREPKPSEKFRSLLLPAESYDYALSQNPKDSIWVETEKNITQIYQYPSIDNKNKSVEIACDANGDVIHSASISFTDVDIAIIHYCDDAGNIINLTDPTCYMMGTIVLADFKKKDDVRYTVSDIGGWPIMKLQ